MIIDVFKQDRKALNDRLFPYRVGSLSTCTFFFRLILCKFMAWRYHAGEDGSHALTMHLVCINIFMKTQFAVCIQFFFSVRLSRGPVALLGPGRCDEL
jgi:hypothetical protein